jgi:hypothetical protein
VLRGIPESIERSKIKVSQLLVACVGKTFNLAKTLCEPLRCSSKGRLGFNAEVAGKVDDCKQ